jgi:8-oxo-dGTP diphosphatase
MNTTTVVAEDSDENVETAILAGDVVLFGRKDGELYVLVIRRRWEPFTGHLAVPGGCVGIGEDTEDAARRELGEETGLTANRLLYVGVYAKPGRDPRGRVVTFAYTALLDHLPEPTAGDDAATAEWVLVTKVLAAGTLLAFDHRQIITDAMRRLVDDGALRKLAAAALLRPGA